MSGLGLQIGNQVAPPPSIRGVWEFAQVQDQKSAMKANFLIAGVLLLVGVGVGAWALHTYCIPAEGIGGMPQLAVTIETAVVVALLTNFALYYAYKKKRKEYDELLTPQAMFEALKETQRRVISGARKLILDESDILALRSYAAGEKHEGGVAVMKAILDAGTMTLREDGREERVCTYIYHPAVIEYFRQRESVNIEGREIPTKVNGQINPELCAILKRDATIRLERGECPTKIVDPKFAKQLATPGIEPYFDKSCPNALISLSENTQEQGRSALHQLMVAASRWGDENWKAVLLRIDQTEQYKLLEGLVVLYPDALSLVSQSPPGEFSQNLIQKLLNPWG